MAAPRTKCIAEDCSDRATHEAFCSIHYFEHTNLSEEFIDDLRKKTNTAHQNLTTCLPLLQAYGVEGVELSALLNVCEMLRKLKQEFQVERTGHEPTWYVNSKVPVAPN